MEKYNDEKLIDEFEAKNYNEEMQKLSNNAIEIFQYYENKIIVQNILNIASKVLSLLEQEQKLLLELSHHIQSIKQNENKVKIRILQDEQNSLKLLYEIDIIQNLDFIKINQAKPLLKNAIDVACNILKAYFELLNFELNTKIKDIIKKYINEIIDLILYLSDYLV